LFLHLSIEFWRVAQLVVAKTNARFKTGLLRFAMLLFFTMAIQVKGLVFLLKVEEEILYQSIMFKHNHCEV